MPVKLTVLSRTLTAPQDRDLPVSDQIEMARDYAEACGFTVVEAAFHSQHAMPLGASGKLYDMIIVESLNRESHRAAVKKAAARLEPHAFHVTRLNPANEDIPMPKKDTA